MNRHDRKFSDFTDAELDERTIEIDRSRQKAKPEKITFDRTNTNAIMAIEFEPVKFAVPGFVSEGLVILAGRQKLGKTWLAMAWSIAVATGGEAMGSIKCEQGDVLYIDMENGPRRIQSRINKLYPYIPMRPDLSRLEWVTRSPQLNEGLIDELERWRSSVRNPRMAVIDVLQRVKPAGNANRNAYENDYSTWAPLQEWATSNSVALVGLHHTKKGGAEDPLEALSGSNGLSACADTTIVLDRKPGSNPTLYVRGRDIEETDVALRFIDCSWSILGDASEVRKSDERSVIVQTLRDNGEPMTPAAIAAATGKHSNNIRQLLFKMGKDGEVFRHSRFRYWISPQPDNTDNDNAGRVTGRYRGDGEITKGITGDEEEAA